MTRFAHLMARVAFVCAAVALLSPSIGVAQDVKAGEKIKIASLDDLPRHTYKLSGSVSELIKSDEQFAAFATEVRANIESDLAKYEIDDAATMQDFYGTLLALDMVEGRFDHARKRIEQIRALEDKEASRLTTGLTSTAFIAASEQTGKTVDDPAFKDAFAKSLAEAVKKLPWDLVQDQLKQSKGQAEIFSENLVMGIVQSRLDPIVAEKGEVSSDLAGGIVSMRYTLKLRLPLKDQIVAVLQDAVDANQVEKPNIWPERSVTISEDQKLKPIVIGVWDSGVDTSVFEGRLFVNKGETVDGKDNDENGFVDDVNGIAFGLDAQYTPELLHPPGDVAGRVDAAMKYMKGFMDVTSAIESTEATELKKHLSSLEPEQVKQFIEDLGFCGSYAHGTHVAGIAVEGNPFARILASRITFDYHQIPKPLTLDLARRHASSYLQSADYFKKNDVRVVNMSWGWSLKEVESGLEANGVGETAKERAELAGKIVSILKQGLHDAMKRTPEILYISAAGNDDNDVEFDEVIPSSIELPNLMIVGAVDQAGEPTSFTSSGKNVVVYANGFEVESYVPGGDRMKMSGTSMASPNVMNLAAKLITLKPSLKPADVIDLIKKGADRREGDFPYLLMNPKKSVELLNVEQ